MNWWLDACKVPNADTQQQAQEHQLQLTKPTGSLSELETQLEIANRLAYINNPPNTFEKIKFIRVLWILIYLKNN